MEKAIERSCKWLMDDLFIHSNLTIPAECLSFQYSRSSGPGGQHVNKVNTRVSVLLDIKTCPIFSESQKERLFRSLKRRIDKTGLLHVTCQDYRSQHANRTGALERMAQLIRDAVKPIPVRKKTRISRAAVERRLKSKKQLSEKKRQRSGKIDY